MEEKKIKQSVVCIALILGLIGYYSTHRSVRQSKIMEMEMNDSSHDIGDNVKQNDVLFHTIFGLEDPEDRLQNSDTTSRHGFIRFIPDK